MWAATFVIAAAGILAWAITERTELSRTRGELTRTQTLLSEASSARVASMKPMPNTVESSKKPLNVMEWDRASKILTDARALIEKDGWQQGATGPVRQWCASTALEGAWLRTPYSIVDFNYARDALSRVIGVSLEPTKARGGTPAKGEAEPDVPYWAANFVDWNDTPGRTEDEVLGAFTEAASLAARDSHDAATAALASRR